MWVSCISGSDLKKEEIATDAWFVAFPLQGGIVWKTVGESKCVVFERGIPDRLTELSKVTLRKIINRTALWSWKILQGIWSSWQHQPCSQYLPKKCLNSILYLRYFRPYFGCMHTFRQVVNVHHHFFTWRICLTLAYQQSHKICSLSRYSSACSLLRML